MGSGRKSGARSSRVRRRGRASSDPESVNRNQAREPRLERAAGRRRPPKRGESGAHSVMSQMLIPKTERVCCPNWATQILSPARHRLNRSATSSIATSIWQASRRDAGHLRLRRKARRRGRGGKACFGSSPPPSARANLPGRQRHRNSARRVAPSESGSVRRTLPEESCEPADSPVS